MGCVDSKAHSIDLKAKNTLSMMLLSEKPIWFKVLLSCSAWVKVFGLGFWLVCYKLFLKG